MKIEKTVTGKWQSINFVEELITNGIWNMLFDLEDVSKFKKIRITLEFEE